MFEIKSIFSYWTWCFSSFYNLSS